MADGKTHIQHTVLLAPFVASGIFVASHELGNVLFDSVVYAIEGMIGCLLGVYISPDLDVDRMHIGRRLLINKNRFWGWLFWLYWWPYAKYMPHRSPKSHRPVLSTIIRVAYLLMPIWAVMLLAMEFELFQTVFFSVHFLMIVFGLICADILHWVDDGMPMWSSKKRRY